MRPYSGYTSELHYSSGFDGDGRTDRASLQVTTRLALTGMDAVAFDTTDAPIVRPYSGYTSWLRYRSRFDTTDARIVRPYSGYTSELRYRSRFDTMDALPLDTSRAPLQVAIRLIRLVVRFAELNLRSSVGLHI